MRLSVEFYHSRSKDPIEYAEFMLEITQKHFGELHHITVFMKICDWESAYFHARTFFDAGMFSGKDKPNIRGTEAIEFLLRKGIISQHPLKRTSRLAEIELAEAEAIQKIQDLYAIAKELVPYLSYRANSQAAQMLLTRRFS